MLETKDTSASTLQKKKVFTKIFQAISTRKRFSEDSTSDDRPRLTLEYLTNLLKLFTNSNTFFEQMVLTLDIQYRTAKCR